MSTVYDDESGFQIILPDPSTQIDIEGYDHESHGQEGPIDSVNRHIFLQNQLDTQYSFDLDDITGEGVDSIEFDPNWMNGNANSSINLGFCSYHLSHDDSAFTQQSNESISFAGLSAVDVNGKKIKEDDVKTREHKIFLQQYEAQLQKQTEVRQLKIAISEKEVERCESTKIASLSPDEMGQHNERVGLTRDLLTSIKDDAQKEDNMAASKNVLPKKVK